MTEVRRTDDEIGVDLDTLQPESASATLGTAVPEVRLPSRERDGFAVPQLSEGERHAVLKELGIDTKQAGLVSHVRLDMGRAYVSGKGHIELSRFSFVYSDVPRAEWKRSLDVDGLGSMDMVFRGLTANKQYLISIGVSGSPLNSSAAFKVGSTADFHANFPASSGQVQYLYGVIKPTINQCTVRVEPIQLEWLNFYNVELSAF
jgi:hypothetical protein